MITLQEMTVFNGEYGLKLTQQSKGLLQGNGMAPMYFHSKYKLCGNNSQLHPYLYSFSKYKLCRNNS